MKNLETKLKDFQSENISGTQLEDAKSKASNLGAVAKDFLNMISLVNDVFSGKYKVSARDLCLIIGTIIYVISPIDLILDAIPVIGWSDDIGAILYVLNKLKSVFEQYSNWKKKA